MPAEHCITCRENYELARMPGSRLAELNPEQRRRRDVLIADVDENGRIRLLTRPMMAARGQHHGRSCRFSRCTQHCTCSQEARAEWLGYIRENRERATFRCSACGNNSTHVCTGTVRGPNNVFYVNTRRFCGQCCTEPGCIMWHTRPCNEGNMSRRQLRTCPSCDRRLQPHAFFQNGWCAFCTGDACRVCSSRRPSSEICSTCHCCRVPAQYIDEDGEFLDNVPSGSHHCQCIRARPMRPTLLHIREVSFKFADGAQITKRAPAKRAMGVELEVCGFTRPKRKALEELYNICMHWGASIGTDSSLGSEHAVEIRTAPAAGEAFVEQVTQIVTAIKACNGFVNQRAGMHVHVDIRRGTQSFSRMPELHALGIRSSLDTLCLAWLRCEDAFFAMADETRQNNQYSRTWLASLRYNEGLSRTNENMANWFSSRSIAITNEGVWHVLRGSLQRYCGLNLTSYDRHRTVEFRLHHGCLNKRMVIAYSMLCSAFVETCLTAKKPTKLLQYIDEHGPLAFLQKIAPTRSARNYLTWRRERGQRRAA